MDGNAGTIIIGAGQAGLAMSRCLRDRGLPHLVLERGQVAQRWRCERWHSFTLLSPNWQTRLPGHRYAGSEPDGFMRAAEVADMLQAYARGAPVRTGVTVDAVRPSAHGWWVLTSTGSYPGGCSTPSRTCSTSKST
jgi:putative flavoprotein involved in K+ transport